MRKFLSLIVVLMLCFNAKAQNLLTIDTRDGVDSDVCTIVIEMFDSYGDGWGSDLLLYSLNGSEDEILEFAEKESSKTHTLEVSKGSHLVIKFYGSNMYGENSIKISYQDGDVLYEASSEESSPNYLHPDNWEDAIFVDTTVDCGGENEGGDDNTGNEGGDEPDTPGDGGDEGDDNPSTPIELAVPQNLVATATATTITLTWEAVDGATRYNIYEGTALLDEVTETTYTIENLAEGRYCYKVSALEDMGYESDAAEACATVGEEPGEGGDDNTGDEGDDEGDDNPSTPIELAVPQNLVATATETTITLTWDAVEGATKYNIYTPSSFDSNVFGITETTYTFENLAEGRYCFQVSACEDMGYESDAAEACATIGEEPGDGDEDPETPVDPEEPGDNPSDPFNPATPTVVATTTETTITLTWNAVDGATEYNIYTPSNFDSNVLGITETTYTFENLITGVEYCFQVSAVSLTGESDAARVCATPGDEEEPVAPAAPVVVADTVTETTVVLTWNAVENATSYNVYMDTVLVKNVTDTVYTVTELTAETTYNFTVTALNNTLESAASNVVTVTTLKVEGIVENTIAFSIYPNPVNDKIYIETEVEVEEVVVYTITGVVAGHQSMVNGQQSTVIDVTNLNSGIYFVKVVTSEGEIVKRIVKK